MWGDAPITSLESMACQLLAIGNGESAYCWRICSHGDPTDSSHPKLLKLPSPGELLELNSKLQDEIDKSTRLQQASVALAHEAGMAEVATGILHNVGNVMNSVNISAQQISEDTKNLRVESFVHAVALMKDHEEQLGTFIQENPRGKKLLPLLTSLSEHQSRQQEQILDEIDRLAEHLNHIKDIVSMQQKFAQSTIGITNEEDCNDLLDTALKISTAELDQHRIDVVKNYSSLPRLQTDKRKILQILINLISNAKHAVISGPASAKKIILSTEFGDNVIVLRIRDFGIGISADNLDKVFQHGFTTKVDGHGFGLHSAALAAKELGGTLTVHSDGQGQGAEFVLRLPMDDTVGMPWKASK